LQSSVRSAVAEYSDPVLDKGLEAVGVIENVQAGNGAASVA
jgi:hypothetical protein